MALPPDLAASLDSAVPAPNPDEAAPPDDLGAPDTTFRLTQQQLADAGIEDAQVGDSFTVTLKGTITEADDGIAADIDEVSDGVVEGAAPKPEEPKPPVRTGPKVKTPDEAGLKMSEPAFED